NGDYQFATIAGMATPAALVDLVFTYTIQDGDVTSPDTDSATLTINIEPPLAGPIAEAAVDALEPIVDAPVDALEPIVDAPVDALEPIVDAPVDAPVDALEPIVEDILPFATAKSVQLDFDETSGSIDTFSHTLGNTGSDEGLIALVEDMQLDLSDVLAQGHTDSLDQYLGLVEESLTVSSDDEAATKQSVVLDKTEPELEDSSSTYVTNGLLAEGGIIISDAFAPPHAPSPEFDSQELL
ncbi:MAG: hypothetical protein ACI9C4_003041, partial [Paraglaciecola sp.]